MTLSPYFSIKMSALCTISPWIYKKKSIITRYICISFDASALLLDTWMEMLNVLLQYFLLLKCRWLYYWGWLDKECSFFSLCELWDLSDLLCWYVLVSCSWRHIPKTALWSNFTNFWLKFWRSGPVFLNQSIFVCKKHLGILRSGK